MTREPRVVHGAIRAALIAAAGVVAMSAFYVAPHITNQPVASNLGQANGGQGGSGDDTTGPAGGPTSGPQASGQAGPNGGPSANAGPNKGPNGNYECARGRNGGATDVGVDGSTIHLAATEVESGIGASFLGPVRFGIFAVLQKVNRAGGVCGRQLKLDLRDDGWDAQTGKMYLDSFIQSGNYFALAVVPSSEGLNAASKAGDIDNAPDPVTGQKGIPVVGSDGMLNSQYHDDWIWPVPTSTAASMRIIAHDAHNHGAKKFAIVYDSYYKFGIEGRDAYEAQIARDGGTIDSKCAVGLDPSVTSYGTQVSSFNTDCGNVDFVALLLEPQVAQTWLQGNPYMGVRSNGTGNGAAGPQPLFDYNFFGSCGSICTNMQLWTSFFPPRYPFDQRQQVQQYIHDLAAVDSQPNDAASAFVEGAYVGMELLVQALQKTGPYLTRSGLKTALDSMTLDDGLNAPLSFHNGNHYANEQMVAYSITNSQGTGDVSFVQNSQQPDPCPSCKDK